MEKVKETMPLYGIKGVVALLKKGQIATGEAKNGWNV